MDREKNCASFTLVVLTGLLRGSVSREKFIKQSKQTYLKEEYHLYDKALDEDLYGDPASALKHYNSLLNLPVHKKCRAEALTSLYTTASRHSE